MSLEGRRIGRYILEKQLDSGPVSAVYLARDDKGRHVALKLLHRHHNYDTQTVARFWRDAQAGIQLQHDHIIPVYDHGTADGYYYIATHYAEGGSLDRVIQQRGKLDLTTTTRIVHQIGAALDYAHNRNVIHRDLKPSNILLSADHKIAYLADFGIAQLTGQQTRTQRFGTVVGTPEFMSPEQIKGENLDRRSDIYSLGVTIYNMLTGKLPFVGEPVTVLFNQVSTVPTSLRKLDKSIPTKVERIVARTLAKNPAQRPATASDVATGLATAMEPQRRTMWVWLLILILASTLLGVAILNRDGIPGISGAESIIVTRLVTATPVATSTIATTRQPTSTVAASLRFTATTESATDTATRVATPTPTPNNTAGGGTVIVAPTTSEPTNVTVPPISLIYPLPGLRIGRTQAVQKFTWAWDGELADDQSFEVRFYNPSLSLDLQHQAPHGWGKETWREIDMNWLKGSGTFEWYVVLIRGTHGNVEEIMTESGHRTLSWEGAQQ